MCGPCMSAFCEVFEAAAVFIDGVRYSTGWWENETYYRAPSLDQDGYVLAEFPATLTELKVAESRDPPPKPA